MLLWDIAIKRPGVSTSYRRILRPISELSTTFYFEADIWSLLSFLESFSPRNKGGVLWSREYHFSVYSSRSQSSPRAFRLCPVVPAATWRITVINFGNVIRFFLIFFFTFASSSLSWQAKCQCHGPGGESPRQYVWDLWSTKWHTYRFFAQCFGFHLSESFYQRSTFIRSSDNDVI
jgi:hypothetical protein